MPRGKRSPIDYTPQFGEGIFRPRQVVDTELAAVAEAAETAPAPSARIRVSRANERTVERTKERIRVRHSFDVWQDQLLALTEIQAQVMSDTGRKPKVGELVQEALDAYIGAQKKRTNGRTNERSDRRTKRKAARWPPARWRQPARHLPSTRRV